MIGIFFVSNLSLPTNVTGIGGLLGWGNVATNNLFGVGILLATFVIILLGSLLKGIETVAAFTVASFVALLISLIMIITTPPLVSLLMPGLFGGLVMLGVLVMATRGAGSIY